MTNRDKEDLVPKDTSTLDRLKLGPNESGSSDYPNIQRFGLTSNKKESSGEGSNQCGVKD